MASGRTVEAVVSAHLQHFALQLSEPPEPPCCVLLMLCRSEDAEGTRLEELQAQVSQLLVCACCAMLCTAPLIWLLVLCVLFDAPDRCSGG